MAGDNNLDVGGVTMTVPGSDLVAVLLPHIVKALQGDVNLQNALVAAIMPMIRAQMATLARATAGAGTTTPRTGPTPH